MPFPWVQDLDFSTLKKENVLHTSANTRTRASDTIWSIHFRGKPLFIVFLLEFQSEVNHFMALRIRTYIDLILEDLIRQKIIEPNDYFPPIFPFVLYTGEQKWNAAVSFDHFVDPALTKELREGLLYGHYAYLDMEQVAIDAGMSNNIVKHLIKLSTESQLSELKKYFANAATALQGRPEWNDLLKYIFSASNASKRFSISDLNKLTEDHMASLSARINARFDQWEQEFLKTGKQEGREEGREEGISIAEHQERINFLHLLLQKNGVLISEHHHKKMETASNEQLKEWIMKIWNDELVPELTET